MSRPPQKDPEVSMEANRNHDRLIDIFAEEVSIRGGYITWDDDVSEHQNCSSNTASKRISSIADEADATRSTSTDNQRQQKP